MDCGLDERCHGAGVREDRRRPRLAALGADALHHERVDDLRRRDADAFLGMLAGVLAPEVIRDRPTEPVDLHAHDDAVAVRARVRVGVVEQVRIQQLHRVAELVVGAAHMAQQRLTIDRNRPQKRLFDVVPRHHPVGRAGPRLTPQVPRVLKGAIQADIEPATPCFDARLEENPVAAEHLLGHKVREPRAIGRIAHQAPREPAQPAQIALQFVVGAQGLGEQVRGQPIKHGTAIDTRPSDVTARNGPLQAHGTQRAVQPRRLTSAAHTMPPAREGVRR